MNEQETSFDRFNDVLRAVDDQIQELRTRFDESRKQFEDQFRKRTGDIQDQLRKNPVYKRAEQARKGLEDQVEQGRAQVYELFGIASKSEIEKLNRRINSLSRKLNEIAKER